MTQLIIAEKKDQAKDIAKSLGFRWNKDHYAGQINGEDAVIAHAQGHLITLETPQKVNKKLSWSKPDSMVPLPRKFEWTKTPDRGRAKTTKTADFLLGGIEKKLKNVNGVILATDPDREGEAIGWEILEYLDYNGPVQRMWLSQGLDRNSIKKAASALKAPEESKGWFRASEARARADWAYQIVTMAYTHYAKGGVFGENLGTGKSLKEQVVSVGRVQTAALNLVLKRNEEIEKFKEVEHYTPSFQVQVGDQIVTAEYIPPVDENNVGSDIDGVVWNPYRGVVKDGEKAPLDKPLFTDKQMVEDFKDEILKSQVASVESCDTGQREDHPPRAFSLVDFQMALGGRLGISSQMAQRAAEDLYEQGYLSYPRTQHSALPWGLYSARERNSILNGVSGLPSMSAQAREAADIHNDKHANYSQFFPRGFSKQQMEHHGLAPTSKKMTSAAFASLRPKKRGLNSKILQTAYSMVAERYVQLLYPPAKIDTRQAIVELPVEGLMGEKTARFKIKTEQLNDPGWYQAFNNRSHDGKLMQDLSTSDSVKFVDGEIADAKTQPPKHFTDLTLAKGMANVASTISDPKIRSLLKESSGIGTPATRSTIIQTLFDRNYMEKSGRKLLVTDKGKELIGAVPSWMSSPEMTALWEDKLQDICDQKDDEVSSMLRDNFVDEIYEKLDTHINTMNEDLPDKMVRTVDDKTVFRPADGKPTAKMAAAVKAIAKSKEIKVPKGTLQDFEKTSEFLKEHMSGDIGPSEGQKKLAAELIEKVKDTRIKVPENVMEDRKACSSFIKRALKKANELDPPTEKQLEFAKKLAENLPEGEKMPEKVETSKAACSEFIEEQKKAQGLNKRRYSGKKSYAKKGYTKKKSYAKRKKMSA